MHGQANINEIYFLIKYIKTVLWRVAKRLSYTEDARCLKVNAACVRHKFPHGQHKEYVPAIRNMGFLVYGNMRSDRRLLTLWKEMLL